MVTPAWPSKVTARSVSATIPDPPGAAASATRAPSIRSGAVPKVLASRSLRRGPPAPSLTTWRIVTSPCGAGRLAASVGTRAVAHEPVQVGGDVAAVAGQASPTHSASPKSRVPIRRIAPS